MRTEKIGDVNRRNGKAAWLRRNAARAYKRMVRRGTPRNCVSDAGRTNAEQWDMWRRYLRGELPATAAYPGTSKHETGLALDLREPARKWVRKFGKHYGWIKDRVRNEPWHFEYDSKKDRSKRVLIKVTKKLDTATYRAISRAVKRPRINKPKNKKGMRRFWRHVQRHINTIMKGEKGWTPLKVDGFDGPLTWEGLRLSLRKTNLVHKPGKNAKRKRIIACWQRGLRAGKRNGWSQKNTLDL